MSTAADLLAPLSPEFERLGPQHLDELKRVGNSVFFLSGHSEEFWAELLSHRSSTVVIGCRDGGVGDLIGFAAVAANARAVLPREDRVGAVRALVHHRRCAAVRTVAVLRGYRRLGVAKQLLQEASAVLRVLQKPPTLLLCRVPSYNDEATKAFERIGFTVYSEMPGLVYGTDRLFTRSI